MFCYQCQETAHNQGCTKVGICGKSPHLSNQLDELIFETIELSALNNRLRQHKQDSLQASRQITQALYTTLTNTNFDSYIVNNLTHQLREQKHDLKHHAHQHNIPIHDLNLNFLPPILGQASILNEQDKNIRSLKQTILYGLKGVAAYTEHARRLGYEDITIYKTIEDTLAQLHKKQITINQLYDYLLGVGNLGIKAMHLIDKANTITFGQPEPTKTKPNVGNRPGILISGHDLQDLKELLDQTQNSNIDIYTHGEMLPAHAYPYFKKYSHFKGNYGNSWWHQTKEFETFNGPILLTSNCLVPPPNNATYLERLFTTGCTHIDGARHIPLHYDTQTKDFSPLITKAHQCKPPEPIDNTELHIGYAHSQLVKLKPHIAEALKNGTLKQIIVMAGCDGRTPIREYYTNFAKALPSDTLILTAGCAKYRYNKHYLQPNPHFPRLLDAGQCNDTYSIILFAEELRKELGYKDLNQLPITYNLAWYEQKAVLILLTLLSLGIKNIKLGPTLPAFLSPDILQLLQKEYHISTINTVEKDLKDFGLK